MKRTKSCVLRYVWCWDTWSLLWPKSFTVQAFVPGRTLITCTAIAQLPYLQAVQLWQVQQLLQAAASDMSSDLASGLQQHEAFVQPWQQAFVQSCLATLGSLNLELQLQSALQQLQQSKSHSDCHAHLARISLLCCAKQVGTVYDMHLASYSLLHNNNGAASHDTGSSVQY